MLILDTERLLESTGLLEREEVLDCESLNDTEMLSDKSESLSALVEIRLPDGEFVIGAARTSSGLTKGLPGRMAGCGLLRLCSVGGSFSSRSTRDTLRRLVANVRKLFKICI